MLLFFYKLLPGEGGPEAMLTCLPEEDDAHYDEAIVCELPLVAGEAVDGRTCCTLELPEQIDGCPLTALEDFMPEQEWAQGEGKPPVITGLRLPASLRRIEPGALEWLDKLECITVAPENPVFEAVNGVLYRRTDGALVRCPMAWPGDVLTVPVGTRRICENGLARCQNLRCILLPEGLEVLESYAVAGCGALEYIRLPESLTAMERGCLMHSKALPWLRIPPGVREIGEGALMECTALLGLSLPGDGALEKLGDHALQRCTQLGSITLPAGLAAVPGRCFDGCTALRQVSFALNADGCSQVELVDYDAFRGCTQLGEIVLPEGVKTIAQYAFADCTALARVALPASLESVVPGSRVSNGMPFTGCRALREITVAEGNDHFVIHDGALIGLEHSRLILCPPAGQQTTYTVPEYIRVIGVEAFAHCMSLERITLPDGLETIENGAFSHCAALTSPELPASLRRIGQGVFTGCKAIKEAVLPEGIKAVSRSLYTGCTALTRVVLPGTVKRLEYGAFEDCTALRELVLPEGITSLGNRVFRGCRELGRVVLPRSLASIDVFANTFEGCPKLALHIPRGSYAEEYFAHFCTKAKKTYY